MVDFVSDEAEIAGDAAAAYIKSEHHDSADIKIETDNIIRYTVPQKITAAKDLSIFFRVCDTFKNVKVVVKNGGKVIYSKKLLKAAPGEMNKIDVKKDMLTGAKVLRLEIER